MIETHCFNRMYISNLNHRIEISVIPTRHLFSPYLQDVSVSEAFNQTVRFGSCTFSSYLHDNVSITFFFIDAQWIIEPYPNNTFPIAGSTLSSICIVVWDHRKPPVRVKFQRKAGPLTWKDIPDTDRVYQTNKTEG